MLVEPVDGKSGGWRAFFKVVVCMILTAAVLLAVFVAVSRLDPHLFDRVLYTPEELEIINR